MKRSWFVQEEQEHRDLPGSLRLTRANEGQTLEPSTGHQGLDTSATISPGQMARKMSAGRATVSLQAITALQRTRGNAYTGQTMQAWKKLSLEKLSVPAGPLALEQKGIGATGKGTITIEYSPESKDKSTKIVFLQVMREFLDGKTVKPGDIAPKFNFQDADTTTKFFHVDYASGEKDPYYNGDDPQDGGTQGNTTSTPKVNSKMTDTPSKPYSGIPAGKSKVNYEFRTAAFSAAGVDKGTYYEFVDWTYEKERGKTDKTGIGSKSKGDPGTEFKDAVKLWAKNHSFTLP